MEKLGKKFDVFDVFVTTVLLQNLKFFFVPGKCYEIDSRVKGRYYGIWVSTVNKWDKPFE